MSACSAYKCTNRPSKQIPGVTFHKFPKEPKRREEWRKALRRPGWKPSRHSRLCSVHFLEEQIDRTSTSVVRLRDGVIPILFKQFPPGAEDMEDEEPPETTDTPSPIIEHAVRASPLRIENRMQVNSRDNNENNQWRNSNSQAVVGSGLSADGSFSTQNTDINNKTVDYTVIVVDATDPENGNNQIRVNELNSRNMGSKSYPGTVAELLIELNKLRNQRVEDKKKIKLLQQKVRRYSKKIASLEMQLGSDNWQDTSEEDEDDNTLDMLEEELKENEMFTIFHMP